MNKVQCTNIIRHQSMLSLLLQLLIKLKMMPKQNNRQDSGPSHRSRRFDFNINNKAQSSQRVNNNDDIKINQSRCLSLEQSMRKIGLKGNEVYKTYETKLLEELNKKMRQVQHLLINERFLQNTIHQLKVELDLVKYNESTKMKSSLLSHQISKREQESVIYSYKDENAEHFKREKECRSEYNQLLRRNRLIQDYLQKNRELERQIKILKSYISKENQIKNTFLVELEKNKKRHELIYKENLQLTKQISRYRSQALQADPQNQITLLRTQLYSAREDNLTLANQNLALKLKIMQYQNTITDIKPTTPFIIKQHCWVVKEEYYLAKIRNLEDTLFKYGAKTNPEVKAESHNRNKFPLSKLKIIRK